MASAIDRPQGPNSVEIPPTVEAMTSVARSSEITG
jgi:hypothetical protein